jgi:ATP-binding cassette subfamily D (ALD) long-chain fatty acid import protein
MTNVLSTLASSSPWRSAAPYVLQWIKTYSRHRITIRRSLFVLFLLRGLLSIHQAMNKFKKEQAKPIPVKPLDHKNKKIDVNMAFLRQIQRLLKIVMPGLRSKEFGMLVVHSGFLGMKIQYKA